MGDRSDYLRQAIAKLNEARIEIVQKSSVYETEPVDLRGQGWFLNMAAECRTELFPLQLLKRIHKIEAALGRKRTIAKGPRIIDIDIILYGTAIVKMPDLEIPHPRFRERRFVLAPLAELVPDLRDPVTRKTVSELLAGTLGQKVRRANID